MTASAMRLTLTATQSALDKLGAANPLWLKQLHVRRHALGFLVAQIVPASATDERAFGIYRPADFANGVGINNRRAGLMGGKPAAHGLDP
jgi:hypothetical protein